MASLTLATTPGFTDVDPSHFDTGNAATDVDIKAVNDNAKFATVRTESFWGFYKHGETVALPVSGADAYVYARSEVIYSWSFFTTAAPPAGVLNGTQTTPTPGATGGPGTLLSASAIVDQALGAVTTTVAYFNGTQTNTHDGILLVITHATRLR